jgi:hypothetical protein
VQQQQALVQQQPALVQQQPVLAQQQPVLVQAYAVGQPTLQSVPHVVQGQVVAYNTVGVQQQQQQQQQQQYGIPAYQQGVYNIPFTVGRWRVKFCGCCDNCCRPLCLVSSSVHRILPDKPTVFYYVYISTTRCLGAVLASCLQKFPARHR